MTTQQSEALRLAAAISNLLCSNEAAARTLAAAADELVRLHAESEMRRAALLDEMQNAAPAQPAAQQGVAYAALPEYGINTASHAHFRVLGFTADQMRAFADATHTLRTSRGQAPALTNLNCKSEQKRLATLWGFVPAQAADSVQEDAARYRWLREGNDAKHGAAWHVAVNLYGCEWDAAIDAAMNKGASQ